MGLLSAEWYSSFSYNTLFIYFPTNKLLGVSKSSPLQTILQEHTHTFLLGAWARMFSGLSIPECKVVELTGPYSILFHFNLLPRKTIPVSIPMRLSVGGTYISQRFKHFPCQSGMW